MDSLMDTGRQLIRLMEKADWMDRLLIFAALAFFFLVVLFILKQRIVDRGLRIAFFWTRFIPDFGGDASLYESLEAGKLTSAISATTSPAAASLTQTLESSLGSLAATTAAAFATAITTAINQNGMSAEPLIESSSEPSDTEISTDATATYHWMDAFVTGAADTSATDTDKTNSWTAEEEPRGPESDTRESVSEKARKDEL
jgi:protein transport protein SEC20